MRAACLLLATAIPLCPAGVAGTPLAASPFPAAGARVTLPPTLPPTPAPDSAQAVAESLLDAEQAFGRLVEERGIRAGFLAVLDSEAIVFQPGPVNAREWYTARDTIAGILSWQPAFVQASGDLGFTTGPWQFRPTSIADDPVAFGEYVSVWTWAVKSSGGESTPVEPGAGPWRLLLDMGVSHPRPPQPGDAAPVFIEAQHMVAGTPREPDAPASRGGIRGAEMAILDADRQFGRLLALGDSSKAQAGGTRFGARANHRPGFRDPSDFYARHTGSYSLLLREGRSPARDTPAFLAQLADSNSLVGWVPREVGVSCRLNFGFTWGEAQFVHGAAPGDTIRTHYLRIWRAVPPRRWQIVLDCIPQP